MAKRRGGMDKEQIYYRRRQRLMEKRYGITSNSRPRKVDKAPGGIQLTLFGSFGKSEAVPPHALATNQENNTTAVSN